jgi:hypothetical protein
MQIGGVQSLGGHDRHGWVGQGLDDGGDHVAGGHQLRLEHDHDRAERSSQPGLERIRGIERHARGDDLDALRLDGGPWSLDHEDLCPGGRLEGQAVEAGDPRQGLGRDDDDAGERRGGFSESRRYRLHRPVERPPTLDLVGWVRGLQFVGDAEVDHLPAGRFDPGPELIGAAIVPPGTGGGALVGERDDLGGD